MLFLLFWLIKEMTFFFFFGRAKIQDPVENILEAISQPDYLHWQDTELYSLSEVRNY